MNPRSVTHATFAIERRYPVTPARVFAAFADAQAKARWFGAGDAVNPNLELDFRVGGLERTVGGPEGGPIFSYEAIYADIVPNERIVTTYHMLMDDTRISVSVATLELAAEGAGTRILYTEMGAYLDGHDTPQQREQGTIELFDALGAMLALDRANA